MAASFPAALQVLVIFATAVVVANCSWTELETNCNESQPVYENKYSLDKNVAVARDGTLELLTSEGAVVAVATHQFSDLKAVAYDQSGGQVYLSDSSRDNASVFRLDLETAEVEPLVPKQEYMVRGIAYDPDSRSLFWTNGRGRTITKMKVSGGSRQPTAILTFTQGEVPIGIALDHCNKVLYWTNSHNERPTIERSTLDGRDRRAVVSTDLYQPLAIAVDQGARRIYWSDDQEGIHFKIEHSNLEGGDRHTLLQGTHHQPFSLTVGRDLVFWSDWIYNAVWSLPKRGRRAEPTMLRRYREATPMGIVANSSVGCEIGEDEVHTTEDSSEMLSDDATPAAGAAAPPGGGLVGTGDYCLHGGEMDVGTGECRCTPGQSGPRCQTQLCFNYCLRGSCYLDPRGMPQCQCERGYRGERCQTDVCAGYCLGGAACSVGAAGEPACECAGGGGGRCEAATGADNGTTAAEGLMAASCMARTQEERVVLVVFGCVVLVMGATVVLLGRQVCVLRRRPRIRKQIIVKKNVTPLTSRPQAGEQCEITIENCCNMNICETPCFEPQLRTHKPQSRKEEKADLLGSMEEDPTLHDDLY